MRKHVRKNLGTDAAAALEEQTLETKRIAADVAAADAGTQLIEATISRSMVAKLCEFFAVTTRYPT
jgi:hypothetical protein